MLIPSHLRNTLKKTQINLKEAIAYQCLLSFFIDKLFTKRIINKAPLLNAYSLRVLKTAYIISLYAIFDRNKKAITLKKLINTTRYLKIKNLSIDRKKHEEFAKKSNTYLMVVSAIEKQLRDVRNKIYAHSTKEGIIIRNKPVLNQTECWLRKAEDIFEEVAELLGCSKYSDEIKADKQKLEKDLELMSSILAHRNRCIA